MDDTNIPQEPVPQPVPPMPSVLTHTPIPPTPQSTSEGPHFFEKWQIYLIYTMLVFFGVSIIPTRVFLLIPSVTSNQGNSIFSIVTTSWLLGALCGVGLFQVSLFIGLTRGFKDKGRMLFSSLLLAAVLIIVGSGTFAINLSSFRN